MQNILEYSKWLILFLSVKQAVLSKFILSLLMVLIGFLFVYTVTGGTRNLRQRKDCREVDPRPHKVQERACELTSYLTFVSFSVLIASFLAHLGILGNLKLLKIGVCIRILRRSFLKYNNRSKFSGWV